MWVICSDQVIARVIAVVVACFFWFLLFLPGHHPAAAASLRQGGNRGSSSSRRRSSRRSRGTACQASGGLCGAGEGEEAAGAAARRWGELADEACWKGGTGWYRQVTIMEKEGGG